MGRWRQSVQYPPHEHALTGFHRIPVNLERVLAIFQIVGHLDRVGVLAAVLQVLRAARLNVQTMQNRVFAGSTAAVATIDVGTAPDEKVLTEIRALEHIIQASVIEA